MHTLSTLEKYIAASVLCWTMSVFAALLALFAFVTLVEELQFVDDGNYAFPQALRYVLLSLPGFMYELAPLALLLGATLALSRIAAASELVVMRASGISLARIVVAMLKAGLLLLVVVMAVGEYLAPLTQNLAEQGRTRALYPDIGRTGYATESNLWVRDDNHFVFINEVLSDASLRGIKIFTVDDDGLLQSVVYAKRAVYEARDAGEDAAGDASDAGDANGDVPAGGWRLFAAKEVRTDNARPRASKNLAWRPGVAPEVLSVFRLKAKQLSAWHLWRYIAHLRANGERAAPYQLALWHKLLLPLVAMVMVLLAMPAVCGHARRVTVERSIATGILAGLAFYILHRASGYLALLYEAPPFTGALAPPLIFLIAALWLIRRAR